MASEFRCGGGGETQPEIWQVMGMWRRNKEGLGGNERLRKGGGSMYESLEKHVGKFPPGALNSLETWGDDGRGLRK